MTTPATLSQIANLTELEYKNGWFEIDDEIYYGLKRLSSHGLMEFQKNPFKYFKKYLEGSVKDDSPALRFGSAFHDAALRPELFDARYRGMDGRSKEARGLKKDSTYSLLSPRDYECIKVMAHRLREHRVFKEFFLRTDLVIERAGLSQITLGENIIKTKIKPDIITDEALFDLKTTDDCTYFKFQESCERFGYYKQAAFYQHMSYQIDLKMRPFYFIVIEKYPPHSIGFYEVAQCRIDEAMSSLETSLYKYAEALKANQWNEPCDIMQII